MKKMLKIVAMLLIFAAVIYAAGCAEKDTKTENESQEVSNQTPAEVAPTTPAETPTETPVVENNTAENVTENVTDQNATAQNVTHISNTQRKMAMIKNRTLSSGTVNVSQNDSK